MFPQVWNAVFFILRYLRCVFYPLIVATLIVGCQQKNTQTPTTPITIDSTNQPNQDLSEEIVTLSDPNPQGAGSSSTSEELIFSAENIDLVAPENIITELYFFGGAGGDLLCTDESEPTLHAIDKILIMRETEFLICGLPSAEKVRITVEFPDQSSKTFEVESVSTSATHNELLFRYIPYYSDPKGIYYFIFSGDGWEIWHTAEVLDPENAELYIVADTIILYKFSPNEEIKLFAYARNSGVGMCQ